MTAKRFMIIKGLKKGTHSGIWDNQKQHNMGIGDELWLGEVVAMLNEGVTLAEENEQLKKENNKLHQKIFEMRTNIALERTEISKQTYTGKKNEKEYLDAKEFLDEIEKW